MNRVRFHSRRQIAAAWSRWWTACAVALAPTLLLGCDSKQPHWHHYCSQYTQAVGVGVGGSTPVVTVTTVCIRYDSVWYQGTDGTLRKQ